MALYLYKCRTHGIFEIVQKMEDAAWDYPCPDCGMQASRDFNGQAPDWVPHTDGFFRTDRKGVVGTGDKQDNLRKQYEQLTGEKAPPPASDVPKNGSEKY